MKKLFLLVLLFMSTIVVAQATDFTYTYQNKTLKYKVLSGDSTVSVMFNGNLYGVLQIPDSVTYNGNTYSVTTIGNHAFSNIDNLTSVTIPNSVTTIEGSAFSNCYSLASVTIPNSVTTIGGYAFYNCPSLASITIPNSVTTIEDWTFAYCRGLTSITIPDSVTTIGNHAFALSDGLTSVTISNSVTTIGNNAFDGCTGLTSITMGSSVAVIGNYAFVDCRSLDTIICKMNLPDTTGDKSFRDVPQNNVTCIVSCSQLSAYRNADVWREFNVIAAPLSQDTASITETLCYGETFTFNGQTYTTSGTYTTTVAGQNGDCDTLYTINLTILPQNTASITEILCYGETFTFNGQTYNATGTYNTTVAGQNGDCDTLYTINLTILPQNTASITETLCYGETFTFNGQTYTTSGTYTPTVAGQSDDCDTLYTINLTILPQNTASITETLCYGETFTFNGQTYTTSGTYTPTVAGQSDDCDTLYTINLTILLQNTASITETLCYGETFTFNGQTYNATGTYTTTVAGQNGDCDTLYTINLTILPQNTPINDEVTISQSELPYSYHGQTYSDFGSYTLTTQDENGCDQVYNLTLVHNSGISEVEGGLTISLYPNPTDNNATLRVKGLSEQATIIITDQQGRVVSSKVLAQGVETLEIETTNLASGVYYIRIQTANTIKTEKLIKK